MRIRNTVVAYDGWLKLLVAAVETPDGQTLQREFVEAGPAAVVLAYDPGRKVALMVRQFRAAVVHSGGPDQLLEAIAGRLDDDSAPVCARREAMEEAGVRLTDLEFVAEVWSSPGSLGDRATLFLAPYALSDRLGPGGGAEGENENITVVEIALSELWSQAQAGQIRDLAALALVLALRARHPQLFDQDAEAV